jgi:hypothetical protein
MKSSLRAAMIDIFALPARSPAIPPSPLGPAELSAARVPKRSRRYPSRPEIILDQTRAAVNLTFRHSAPSAALNA